MPPDNYKAQQCCCSAAVAQHFSYAGLSGLLVESRSSKEVQGQSSAAMPEADKSCMVPVHYLNMLSPVSTSKPMSVSPLSSSVWICCMTKSIFRGASGGAVNWGSCGITGARAGKLRKSFTGLLLGWRHLLAQHSTGQQHHFDCVFLQRGRGKVSCTNPNQHRRRTQGTACAWQRHVLASRHAHDSQQLQLQLTPAVRTHAQRPSPEQCLQEVFCEDTAECLCVRHQHAALVRKHTAKLKRLRHNATGQHTAVQDGLLAGPA